MAKLKALPDKRGRYMQLYCEVFDSPAFWCLGSADRDAYMALLRQKGKTNNGDLSLPLSLARHRGIKSPATLAKSLRALVAVGLIAVTRKGGSQKGGQRLPTLYRLTDYEVYENPAKHICSCRSTNEWKAVKNIAHGRALIGAAESKAKEAAASEEPARPQKSITRLQVLAATASNDESVAAKAASETEAWKPPPLQEMNLVQQARMPMVVRVPA